MSCCHGEDSFIGCFNKERFHAQVDGAWIKVFLV